MEKTLCQKCFHYNACDAIDVSGAIGNPECENLPCDHFIDAERVKIQDKANWIEEVKRWGDGTACICYYCTHCGQQEHVKIFKEPEWEAYYSEHYRDGLELPKFCKDCGSEIGGIVEHPGD